MLVFRLTKKKYSGQLSGRGASLSDNRWNSRGVEIIYTAESRALAMAEVVVHLPLSGLPEGYVMMEINIPGEIEIVALDPKILSKDWNNLPDTSSTRIIGDEFIRRNRCAVMQVPSAVVPGDSNYLINPFHADFGKIGMIKSVAFPFDKRLFI